MSFKLLCGTNSERTDIGDIKFESKYFWMNPVFSDTEISFDDFSNDRKSQSRIFQTLENFWTDILPGGSGTQQVVTNGAYQHSTAGCLTNLAYSGTDYSRELKLSWNSQYQLEEVLTANQANDTNQILYSYDVLGRRVSRAEIVDAMSPSQSTNEVFFIYDGDQVVADVDADGTLLRTYVWGDGIDDLLCFTDHTTSNTYFAIKDVQNTVHAL